VEVLVVSSDLVVEGTFERVANKCGHNFESVATGADALRVLAKKQFDVVLLDTSLPDMKSYVVIAEIKKMLHQSKIIVVVESNLSRLESADRDEKIDYYLIKPLDENYLENIINTYSQATKIDPIR
jgi:CheY-like chemotaxis protein